MLASGAVRQVRLKLVLLVVCRCRPRSICFRVFRSPKQRSVRFSRAYVDITSFSGAITNASRATSQLLYDRYVLH